VLVGVLLLPLGWLMLYAARHSAARVAWAQVIARTTSELFASPRPVRPKADTANPSVGGSVIC
jgi:hypothetical protein